LEEIDGTRDGGRGGGWQVSGGGETHGARTQQEGIPMGRQALDQLGGGELVVKGRNGQARMQNTYRRNDPRGSRGQAPDSRRPPYDLRMTSRTLARR
jgi:hypothetical protein